jgi:hypothetical protein
VLPTTAALLASPVYLCFIPYTGGYKAARGIQERQAATVVTDAFKIEAKDICEDQVLDSGCNYIFNASNYIEYVF